MQSSKFVVLEGVCCSGKTTLANRIIESFKEEKIIYNHGSMSYSELGREFYTKVDELDIPISALYYYTDLLCDTRNSIVPKLEEGYIVLKDRYYEYVNKYTNAYGDFHQQNLDIYRISEVLKLNQFLLEPAVKIYCIPPYDIILERMKKSKNTQVHEYYREHPDFNYMVYQELQKVAMNDKEAIIIDSSDELSIQKGMEKMSEILNMVK